MLVEYSSFAMALLSYQGRPLLLVKYDQIDSACSQGLVWEYGNCGADQSWFGGCWNWNRHSKGQVVKISYLLSGSGSHLPSLYPCPLWSHAGADQGSVQGRNLGVYSPGEKSVSPLLMETEEGSSFGWIGGWINFDPGELVGEKFYLGGHPV